MPATGGGRAVHAVAHSKRTEKSKSVESMASAAPRRDSASLGAAPRPLMKSRAYSTPIVPQAKAVEDNASLYSQDGEEIADDAFFQRYDFPQPVASTKKEVSESSVDSSSDTEGPLSPTHMKNRQPAGGEVPSESSSSDSNNDATPTMLDMNIAVIGAPRSGKTSFMRKALGLHNATPPAHCRRKWTIDGIPYAVRLVELKIDDVHATTGNVIEWPTTANETAVPRIDGAVTIYDVTGKESLEGVPDMMSILSKAQVPFVLVACKCDQHPAHREVDPAVVEQKAKSFLGDVRVFQSSAASGDTQRECLTFMARAVIAAKRARSQASTARQRASSSAVRSIHKDIWRKHERASSEISVRFRRGANDGKGNRYKPSDANKTFFNAEESPGYDSQESDDQDSDTAPSIMSVKPSDENGYTFDQLVDRLLVQPMSKNDSKFVAIFLSLYRRFATPGQLLDAMLKRFEAVGKERSLPLIKTIAQLRYLAILQEWVSHYPGDFAFPTTRRLIRKFASALATSREYSVAASEIIRDLEWVSQDDDTEWACSDRQRAQNDQTPNFHHNVLDEDSDEGDFSTSFADRGSSENRMSIARSSVHTGGSRATNSTNGSVGSSQALLTQVEKNERLAQQLEPNPIKAISKIQWHQLMVQSDEAIAKELTRIDWIMFSSVRPRDLVRHVSLNAEEKKKCRNLENVTRMTEHFNHVAYLVTNYILIRDKPKHRALMLEKWMKIARQLRKLNNYNALGAIIAGIKGAAVHRLLATRDLVPQAVTHDFLKLDILMGPQKSHFAYRLAWENSSGERIPYIPLHRRDLVSASEGNSTFVGDKKKTDSALAPHPGVNVLQAAAGGRDSKEAPPGGVVGKERINWKKFEIMGEVIVGVQRAQGTPYPSWLRCEEVRNLILDVKISKDEDELYERSTHLEAPGAGEKGRFAKWFREPRLSLPHLPPSQNYQAADSPVNYVRI
ncbi:ras guanine nucleotide exchange factor domain-containing protein [Ampelomyces quisqualis]|uniref:Ras guanine nucleotide exchange factor domain-containing protein n=1 Tax=Ampelomyces quisqualis TaxID=50730 RepID=A0A6A5QQ87_AMPQU|nr:ras guanine nucleotide exchange factor domain-containing protein [Ampelomyces quisqualis]